MRCGSVRQRLPGYLDGALASADRARVREHLNACGVCRDDLERYRKLAVLLSRKPAAAPPPDLAVRIRVATAQVHSAKDPFGRFREWSAHLKVVVENAFRPFAVPATGGLFSAAFVFLFVLGLMVPRITVSTVKNDVPINLMQPAALVSLSDFPAGLSSDQSEADLALPHGLLVDVIVDAHGQMIDYQILAGPRDPALRRQLDQMLLFSRFRPMMSFGRPTPGGHVVLSFTEVRVRG